MSFSDIFYRLRLRRLISNKNIIDKISFRSFIAADGQKLYESIVYLNSALRGSYQLNDLIFSKSDGGAISNYKGDSIEKGVTEALERWAYYQCRQESHLGLIAGIPVNPTSAGFAAFPERRPIISKANARLEALEHWSLLQFSRGKLCVNQSEHAQIEKHNSTVYQFQIHPHFWLAIASCNLNSNIESFAYGFGSATDPESAKKHAIFELYRSKRVLAQFLSHENYKLSENLFERRMLFFAKEGRPLFEELLTAGKEARYQIPQILVDHEVIGPWSQYVKVWRTLYDENENHAELASDTTFVF